MPIALTNRGVVAAQSPSVRLRWTAPVLATALAGLVWSTRAYLVGPRLEFLWWNLALAWLPWLLTAAWLRAGGAWRWLLGAAWLVFLPNAPYLVTDLVHLKGRPPVPLWLDVLLLASFALAGLSLGWTSLDAVSRALSPRLGRWGSFGFVSAVLLLTGFGIYLGRFLRLNSWDVVIDPLGVAASVVRSLTEPRALFFSFAFALLVGAGYLLVAPPVLEGRS